MQELITTISDVSLKPSMRAKAVAEATNQLSKVGEKTIGHAFEILVVTTLVSKSALHRLAHVARLPMEIQELLDSKAISYNMASRIGKLVRKHPENLEQTLNAIKSLELITHEEITKVFTTAPDVPPRKKEIPKANDPQKLSTETLKWVEKSGTSNAVEKVLRFFANHAGKPVHKNELIAEGIEATGIGKIIIIINRFSRNYNAPFEIARSDKEYILIENPEYKEEEVIKAPVLTPTLQQKPTVEHAKLKNKPTKTLIKKWIEESSLFENDRYVLKILVNNLNKPTAKREMLEDSITPRYFGRMMMRIGRIALKSTSPFKLTRTKDTYTLTSDPDYSENFPQ
jgi:hypothetical protein